MEEWAQEAIKLWQENRVNISRAIMETTEAQPHIEPDDPIKHLPFDDVIQMIDGFGAMIAEELEGRGNDIRETYMLSVIPGILAQGQSLAGIVASATINAVIVNNLLVPQATEENREKIATFYKVWYAIFNRDIVKVGLESGAKT